MQSTGRCDARPNRFLTRFRFVSVGEISNVVGTAGFAESESRSVVEVSAFTVPLGSVTSVPSTVPAPSIRTWVDRDDTDESCSVSSDSCWGEMEDLIGEENVEWGLLPCPAAPVVVQTYQTTWKDWSVTFLSCLDPMGMMWIRRHAPQEGTPIPTRPNLSGLVVRADSPTMTTCQGRMFSTKCGGPGPWLIVVVLQKWWSGADADTRDYVAVCRLSGHYSSSKQVGRVATDRDTRSRTRQLLQMNPS